MAFYTGTALYGLCFFFNFSFSSAILIGLYFGPSFNFINFINSFSDSKTLSSTNLPPYVSIHYFTTPILAYSKYLMIILCYLIFPYLSLTTVTSAKIILSDVNYAFNFSQFTSLPIPLITNSI